MLAKWSALGAWFLACELLLSIASAQIQFPPDIPTKDTVPGVIYFNTARTTRGSPFLQNLELVIRFLYSSTPPDGFATCLGYGEFPDTAYAHSACYGMADQQGCSDCIKHTYTDIQQVAPLTVGARYWINGTDDRCHLRFEAYSFRKELVSSGTLGVLGPNGTTPYSRDLASDPKTFGGKTVKLHV
ncbi:uncharacterized protein LOC112342519 [Selaginella moellendorffii]|uniref:uncharacterized protein LOC112342519 n=1 Tax=Selaginella moellendorffii TaxID=88036 RepID=UPI000D1D1162|nr:uncharacterized protein LOC112342519 [Selaginella moellendorffii]|eukprot:XP_024520254.1 uncharacterized protein LOC112342519 [Selaginella moellendorffii]